MKKTPTFARAGALAAATIGLVALGSSPVAAHVSVSPSTASAGDHAVLTFSVGHGCDGSATTELAFQIPEPIVAVTPTVKSGWSVDKTMETLDEPVDDGHGGEYTERVKEVVYKADTPLPDGFRSTFELSLSLPDAEGENVVFPVVQKCVEGETAWIQTAAEGEDEPDEPAPFVTLIASEGDGHGEAEAGEETSDSGGSVLEWIALVLGALGFAAGGTALARSKKSA